jgi:hypothetical protein
MARKKKPARHGWLRTVLIFSLVPIGVWLLAFVLWLNWYDLQRWLGNEPVPQARTRAAPPAERIDSRKRPVDPRENLFDEDRQKLEEILKRRG